MAHVSAYRIAVRPVGAVRIESKKEFSETAKKMLFRGNGKKGEGK